ncbi:hypothetical protein ASG41_16915 [Modestobacter sp. Leaf380]|nr:hypothetical protein ASG41_16915 [Modestobacter sp. Leaf380]
MHQLLGISVDHMSRVTQAAASGRNSTTEMHPKSSPGGYMYGEATAQFRRETVGDPGWDFDEAGGQPRTFNNERRVSVIVRSGDEFTGCNGPRAPRTKHTTGSETRRKISVNQLAAFDLGAVEAADDTSVFNTWVLLLAVVDGEVRGELSRPASIDQAGHINTWTERLLLPATPLGGGFAQLDEDERDDDQGDDLGISWKA